MTARDDFDAMTRILDAVADRTWKEKLLPLQLAWLAAAGNARTDALFTPDGFTKERAHQVDALEKMVALVAGDEPDLEAERLLQEGDLDGLSRYMWDRLDKAREQGE